LQEMLHDINTFSELARLIMQSSVFGKSDGESENAVVDFGGRRVAVGG